MAKGGVRTDGRTDGRLEIPPCVLQDIGPLGPLPKKARYTAKQSRTVGQGRKPLAIKRGRIHGNPVADGWTGAVMQNLLGIKKCDLSQQYPKLLLPIFCQ